MTPLTMAIIAGALACTVSGQLLLKGAAQAANIAGVWFNPRSMFLLAIAVTLYGVMTLLWTHALREVSLARAFPIMALSYLIIPVAEHYLFSQDLHLHTLIGGGVIIVGIAVTQL